MRKELLTVCALSGLLFFACGGKEDPVDPIPPVTAVPHAPTNLKLHKATETSLQFQWDNVPTATSYAWELQKDGAKVKEGTSGTRNATIDGLTKATDYKFGVKAINAGGASSMTWTDARTEGTVDPVDPTPTPSDQYYADFSIPEAEEDGVARAFPGAEGGGMYTTGGRGGKVYHVTTLEDGSASGTLRYGIEKGERPLTIVFDVAGTIELKSDLKISKGDLTIAGQTAPGDGICLKNYTTNLAKGANNVIIRFLRFRLGDEAPWSASEIEAGKADGEDCIWGRYLDHVILDHCSMSWSVDEAASFYGNEYFTMQWCLIAESMKNCKLHTKGNHGYGGLWGGKNASFHHNVLAHHDSRNARIDHPHIYEDHKNPARRGNVDLRNNVIYNWGDNSTYGGEGGHFNLVNNYYKKGPSSKDRKYFVDAYGVYSKCSTCNASNIDDGYPELYLDGNVYAQYGDLANGPAGIYWHNKDGHAHYNETVSAPLVLKGKDGQDAYTTTHTADRALDAACSYAGASLARDAVDIRISQDVKEGTGSLINDIADVKAKYGSAWPAYSANDEQLSRVKDSDADGMPDWFEEQFGLGKSNKDDAAAITLDKNGRYTNLEMYLHYLVKDIVAAQNAGGTYTKL